MSLVAAVWFALSAAGEAKQYQKPGMKPVLCNLFCSWSSVSVLWLAFLKCARLLQGWLDSGSDVLHLMS